MNTFNLTGEFFLYKLTENVQSAIDAGVGIKYVFVNSDVYTRIVRTKFHDDMLDFPLNAGADFMSINIANTNLEIRICESLSMDQFIFGV